MKSINTILRSRSSVGHRQMLLVSLIVVVLVVSFLYPFATTACSCLTAVIKERLAQSVRRLTPEQNTQLNDSADQIKSDLGCQ